MERVRRLDARDRVVGLGALAVFGFGFLNWVELDLRGFSGSGLRASTGAAGFASWHGKFAFLTSLFTLLLLASPTLREQLLARHSAAARALVVLALASATLILGPVFFAMGGNSVGASFDGPGLSVGRTLWFYLALLGAIAAVVAAWSKWTEAVALSSGSPAERG